MAPSLRLAPVQPQDLDRVVALETASYPSDEAASPDTIRFRAHHANAFFQVARRSGDDARIVGFVNGTLVAGDELTDESMREHDPHGTTLCIHSVVIDPAMRRQRLAAAMLQHYVHDVVVATQHQVQRLAMIAKADRVGFVIRCGFTVTRLVAGRAWPGGDPWVELLLDAAAARRLAVVQVDAFSGEIFQGNPAAVVVMPQSLYTKPGVDKWMLHVAKERNVSATAYVSRRCVSAADDHPRVISYDLRWFTPGTEIELCGHGTLSSAFVLFHDGHVPVTSTIHFHTLSGVLVCKLERHNGTNWITMDFPLRALQPPASDLALDVLAKGLNITVSDFIAVKQTQASDVLVHVPTDKFADVTPNFGLLNQVEAHGIIVTSAKDLNDKNVDFQSRFFGLCIGVSEDPVTGSAHCALAGYWSQVLKKNTLYAHQACPSRGGYLSLELPSDRPDRVVIKGEAVVSLRGTLLTSP